MPFENFLLQSACQEPVIISFCHLPAYLKNMAQVRQNFHADCEAGINRQINLELYASYVYMSMVSEFLFQLN